jgi:hypothetical protein
MRLAMASSVSQEPGSVVKTVGDISASNHTHCEKGGPVGRLFFVAMKG